MSNINVDTIIQLHAKRITEWQSEEQQHSEDELFGFIENNHRNNFLLWNEEDKARRDDKGAEFVYHAKRNIDGFNQQRNNCMEQIDEWIFHHFKPKNDGCPIHSESPGMMIDRLSILSLKEYHMHQQTIREDTDHSHREACQKKLDVIIQQRLQLSQCLTELLDELTAGTRTFRIYHQFKMYNDPNLNPEIYRHQKHQAE